MHIFLVPCKQRIWKVFFDLLIRKCCAYRTLLGASSQLRQSRKPIIVQFLVLLSFGNLSCLHHLPRNHRHFQHPRLYYLCRLLHFPSSFSPIVRRSLQSAVGLKNHSYQKVVNRHCFLQTSLPLTHQQDRLFVLFALQHRTHQVGTSSEYRRISFS